MSLCYRPGAYRHGVCLQTVPGSELTVIWPVVTGPHGGQMKAFVMKEIGRVGFMDKPIPTPAPNDAVVRATRALI